MVHSFCSAVKVCETFPLRLYEGSRIYNRVVVLQQVISHGPFFSSGQKRKKSSMKRGLDIIPGNWGVKGGRTKHDIFNFNKIFNFRFFHESVSPKPLSIPLGQFQIFFRKFVDLFAAQGSPSVSLTPVAN
jgi:hypothetical protein